jgi:hypothetical protein
MDMTYEKEVERWDVFEAACPASGGEGNPFTDYVIHGNFT